MNVGEILLFNIGDSVLRPFLVVALLPDHCATGELFLSHLADWNAEWVQKNMWARPRVDQRSVWVKSTREGPGVGEVRDLGHVTAPRRRLNTPTSPAEAPKRRTTRRKKRKAKSRPIPVEGASR